ncbi:MAG: stage 0 sporulation family protein [Clostridia bacterium]|nr:stage 0 sporulation family protein [Clostridia bacterium]
MTEDESEEAKVEVIGVRFKKAGKVYYFDPGDLKLKQGDGAVVETARGPELGDVASPNKMVREKDIVKPLRPVIRIATKEDIAHGEGNRKKEDEAFSICLKKIEDHGLEMKLVDVEYTFDNSKLLFYFTSAGRVDFRELVKDLASVFHTRIELRQIGIRDETKIMGGLGVCGRPLCCASFLSDFVQVSIKMAKEQNLSLNSTKISGTCGRLMCCLRYEHDTYEAEAKLTPPVDSVVKTEDGVGTVIETIPLQGLVKVRFDGKNDISPKFYHRDTVKVVKVPAGKGVSDEEPDSEE